MSETEIYLKRQIDDLQRELDRLKTNVPEIGGVWQSWTPTLSLIGSGTVPTYSTVQAKYAVVGKILSGQIILQNTSGGTAGSGAVVLLCSYPVAPSFSSIPGYGAVYDAGLATINTVTCRHYSTSAFYLQRYNGGNVLASEQSNANRYIFLSLMYPI